jgi:hypothetical protein
MVDDLATGCQPFMVVYSGNTNHSQSLADASISQQLAMGDQSASLADYRTLRSREKIKFPRDTLQVCITLTRYAVLCQALFQGTGPTNPLVDSVWKLVAALNNASPFITERYQPMVRSPAITAIYFACVLRAVQVQVYEYLYLVQVNVAENHEGVELPEFRSLITDLKRGTFPHSSQWIPIPEEYLESSRGPAGGGSVSSGTRAASSVIGGGSAATSITNVSALTEPTTAPIPRIVNPQPDTDFSGIRLCPGGTRPVL